MASNELDCWKTDLYIEEYIELMNFLIERTKDVESPLSINQLAKEFKEKSGSSQTISCLFYRIRTLREKAAELDTIDTATKVRMMFALSASIDEDFLKELRVNSHVEVDGKNRITEYKAKDGRLEFEGDHSGSAKRRSRSKKMVSEKSQNASPKTSGSVKRAAAEVPNSSKRAKDSSPARSMKSEDRAPDDSDRIPESKPRKLVCRFSSNAPSSRVQQLLQPEKQSKTRSDKSQKDSDDGSQDSMLKTPGSVQRSAPEVPNSSKKAKDSSPAGSMKPEDHAPNDSAGIPESGVREPPNSKIQQLLQPEPQKKMVTEKSQDDSADRSMNPVPENPESVKRAATEVPNLSEKAKDSSSARSKKSKDHAPDDSARTPESGASEQSSSKTPNPGIQLPRQPFPETPRARTRQEAPVFRGAPSTPGGDIPQEKPIKTEPGLDDGYTPRIKLLEAIQSLVLSLDMPSLSPLLTRIEEKLRELSSNDKIPNDEMVAALELLVVKIANDSVSNLPETVESVSLSHLLCYLKSLILNSKLEGLENLLEKIKRRIKNPSTKDKMIPVEKVTSTLQPILDVIGF
ncbi:CBN-SET-5 protein [Caenorhabditis brenneri]|uniref:CBN-SET-5 protein n=1 Tax=Caenorhabditis brenneri TaxID=135651 RepID=G0NGG3_CAEBE|nr:CBN-SET-5 protein [Caenorhabditis brenneri]